MAHMPQAIRELQAKIVELETCLREIRSGQQCLLTTPEGFRRLPSRRYGSPTESQTSSVSSFRPGLNGAPRDSAGLLWGVPLDPVQRRKVRQFVLEQSNILESAIESMRTKALSASLRIPSRTDRGDIEERLERLERTFDGARLSKSPKRLTHLEAELAVKDDVIDRLRREREVLREELETEKKRFEEMEGALQILRQKAEKISEKLRSRPTTSSLREKAEALQHENQSLMSSYSALQLTCNQLIADRHSPSRRLNSSFAPSLDNSYTQPLSRSLRSYATPSRDRIATLQSTLTSLQVDRARVLCIQVAGQLGRIRLRARGKTAERERLTMELDIVESNIAAVRLKIRQMGKTGRHIAE